MAKILLVEDDPDQLQLRTLTFERAGHQVLGASNVAEALKLLASSQPDIVVTDLHLPKAKDGAALIRAVRERCPKTRVAVLSGLAEDLAPFAEAGLVDEVLKKPVRSQKLLAAIARLAVWTLCLWQPAAAESKGAHPFQLDEAAEVVADFELSAPGADWGRAGRESVLANVTVDGAPQQQVMVFLGSERHHYRVFLGELAAGAHQVVIERNPDHSARGINLEIHGVTYRQFKPPDADYDAIANAPVIYARANTMRKFTDIPLLVYCERLPDKSLRYSVIFSNEDGGTSTRALMARWGRVTDIEHVYQVWPGNKTLIQSPGHKDVEFHGQRQGLHPVLAVVTDNNMVSGEGRSAVRYQLAPVVVDLARTAREQVMDQNPFTYSISARELEREGKIRKFGAIEGSNVSAPENYLFVELHGLMKQARLAVWVRLEGENFFRASNLGMHDLAIERSGWMRTAIELPPATQPPQIAELGLQCLAEAKTDGAGACRVESIGRLFFLNAAQIPGENFFRPRTDRGPWNIPAGQMRMVSVR